MSSENPPLAPRNGHTLRVGNVCRISGCAKQKEESLDDQEDNAKEVIADLYSGQVEFDVIATTGKGEWLDRPELEQIELALKSREYDIFIFDDLSRLIRGGDAARLLGVGVDHGTRSICVKDGIDTCDPTWEEDALNACSESVAHIERTSKRVKQKCMNRFKKYGATPKRPIYGYVVPEEAKSFDEWQKDPNAVEFIREGARILGETLNGEATAEYFRKNQVPVGPYARNADWNGTMVLRFYRNPLLKGYPQRGKMRTVKHHGTGHRQSKRNPNGPTHYHVPHLAHFEPMEFDDLVARLADRNEHYRRKTVGGVDPQTGVSRKRSRYPGRHVFCGVCGRRFVFGGHGQTHRLMCNGARQHRCWNGITFDGPFAAREIAAAVMKEIETFPEFSVELFKLVEEEAEKQGTSSRDRMEQIRREESRLDRYIGNIVSEIREGRPCPSLREELHRLENEKESLLRERYQIERIPCRSITIGSVEEVKKLARDVFRNLAPDSQEFSRLMQKLIPKILVFPYRLCDGGKIVLRARFTLSLVPLLPPSHHANGFSEILRKEIVIDLFEPPQREAFRKQIVKLRSPDPAEDRPQGLTEKSISQMLGITKTAVQAAAVLQREMDRRGLSDPYVQVLEPPNDCPKLRRHHHPRYKFEPLIDGTTV